MEIVMIDTNRQVFGIPVPTFPAGIGEAFDRLMAMVPGGKDRSFYGICLMDGKGSLVYIAAIEELQAGEAEQYQCGRYTIHKGEYLAVTLLDWPQKTASIKGVFQAMMQDERFAHDTPSVEWYKNDHEMVCLLQANPVKTILAAITAVIAELNELLSPLDEMQINFVPFADSWTAAQLATHVTKSIRAMAQAMEMKGKLVERDPAARARELKDMFLNFSVKFQSPSFIIPENMEYKRQSVTAALENTLQQFGQNAAGANPAEVISLPGFGEITKMELLHFVLYHTQRHVHQLKNIVGHIQPCM